ncbi:hypothetical protein HMPREF9418_2681 [Neisseria macacae ATCC 33926]|uniref:Uncharacterized protein n=1 Tax=Neisseria macacae ATCC 33926 TaxID=997348 RepID=A0AA36XJ30_9NEIS|nr:hypothetical protein HMPREF9418_2681 [Neisseria macacae ATCC 33926]
MGKLIYYALTGGATGYPLFFQTTPRSSEKQKHLTHKEIIL